MGKEIKGSQVFLQEYLNEKPDQLNIELLCASPSLLSFAGNLQAIEWKSPLKEDNYYTYRDDFLELYLQNESLPNEDKTMKLRKFWPSKGPVWDGMGLVHGYRGERGIILLEAQSDLSEMDSSLRATQPESRGEIIETLEIVNTHFGGQGNVEHWIHKNYQLGSRLAFLYILNELLGIPTWLGLVHFVEGYELIPMNKKDWTLHYATTFQSMEIGPHAKLLDRLIPIYPSLRNR